MDFRQLNYLVTLADQRHFARAADECCVTQPTLSSRIRQLEEEFGVRLVKRDQRFRGLTSQGETVVEWARQVLEDSRALKSEFAGADRNVSDVLSIGVVPSATPLASICTAYFQSHGICHTAEIHTLSSLQIQKGLMDGDLTLGISYRETDMEYDAKSYKVCNESYTAVYVDSSNPTETRVLDWSNLEREKLCLPTDAIASRRVIDRCLKSQSDSKPLGLETDCWLTMLQAIRRNGLVGIMPLHIIGILTIPVGTSVVLLPSPKDPLSLYFLSSNQNHRRGATRRAIEAIPGIQNMIKMETSQFSGVA